MCRLIFIFFIFWSSLHAQSVRYHFTENKMGSPFHIIFYHSDSTEAARLGKDCYLLVDSLNNIFSNYDSTSEISRLADNAGGGPQKISSLLFDVLVLSEKASKKSGNSFSIHAGALTILWRKARYEKRFPSKMEIRNARQLSARKNFKFSKADSTVILSRPGVSLDFGGIVKGYTAQKIINFLHSKNINSALADAGGDIVMSDAPPGKNGWTVAVSLPGKEDQLTEKNLVLNNMAVATSGNRYQYMEHKGKKFSHILNPKTGYGITSQLQVTTIAKNGSEADWLATAFSILSTSKSLKLANQEEAAVLLVTIKDGDIFKQASPSFNDFFNK